MKNMNRDLNHPVWDVYDEFRTVKLNVRYYESKLKKLSRSNAFTEYILAISTSSSVAGLWLWENNFGGYLWKGLGALAIFLALGRPIFNLTDKIKNTSEILGAYLALDNDFNKLKIRISQDKKYDKPLQEEFKTLLETKGYIISKTTYDDRDDALIKKCTNQVNIELPAKNFFIPTEE
ncbi:hypothetical protein METP2_01221 [Methanosarcinales archaeon]|nr:hypothetical protein [Candidatus Methanoperedens sp.]CAG0968038.1 hypothetical protein METP2_01221 [Methanosarcinales archaeon]